jgi:DNA polymerase I
MMELLPAWNERLRDVKPEDHGRRLEYALRKSPEYYTSSTTFIETGEAASAMIDLACQRPLSHIGFDTEFRYDRPGVLIDKRNTAYDPRSIHPLILSLAMAEPVGEDKGRLYPFVVDLRKPAVLPLLNEIFRLPVPFSGHHAKVELFCLWQLGLSDPSILWDTFIFEKALCLGRNHHKYKLKRGADEIDQIRAKDESTEKESFGFSLVATCQRYGVVYSMETEKERLQKSFLSQGDNEPFSEEQITYASEDAIAAARLYPLQMQKALQEGLVRHCEMVEMRWVVTNARIEWNGVRVDERKRDDALVRIGAHRENLEKYLASEYGITNFQSYKQLRDFFQKCGLLHAFRQNDKLSFDKGMLKKNAALHPAIDFIRAARRAADLLADKLMSSEFIGADGRIHAEHRQLGTDTGRQTSRWPNFLGLDRVLRPLVIPEEGYGIGEVDWSQVEVGVAAAVYHDEALIRMFNTGDVYSTMAQHFFQDELSEEDPLLPGKEFKRKHPNLRDQMKSCTLGIIYGITPTGLAHSLNTSKTRAAALQERFMAMFPDMQKALARAADTGSIRGYASTNTGLRRNRGFMGKASRWERNWLTNHPVQGSAAVVFKAAGNRLHQLYQRYGAKIIIPLHDAFIFEAPLEEVETVAELTSRVMCETLQEYFPVLRPQAEVNIVRPDCWTKDGDGEALSRWIDSLQDLMKTRQEETWNQIDDPPDRAAA